MIPRDQEGRSNSPVGCRTVGNPIKGFPAGRSPAKNAQTKPRQQEETQKRFNSLARFYAPDKSGVRHAAISKKLRPRGHPRAACGPPFLLFGLRPRRNGVGFRPLRRATKGAAFGICQPFEKGWTENFSWLPYTKSPARNNRPRRGILRKPQINIWAASHRWCAGPHELHGCRACRGTPHTAS